MSITVKYNDIYGKDVTDSEIRKLDWYSKLYYDDGILSRKEFFEKGKLVVFGFYVSSYNEIGDFLIKYPDAAYYYNHLESDFKIEESLGYKGGILVSNTFNVFDSNNNRICYKRIRSQIDKPDLVRVEKFFYVDGSLRYTFDYNVDGSCFMISDEFDHGEEIYPFEIGRPGIDFIWDGLDYYKNAEPLVPLN